MNLRIRPKLGLTIFHFILSPTSFSGPFPWMDGGAGKKLWESGCLSPERSSKTEYILPLNCFPLGFFFPPASFRFLEKAIRKAIRNLVTLWHRIYSLLIRSPNATCTSNECSTSVSRAGHERACYSRPDGYTSRWIQVRNSWNDGDELYIILFRKNCSFLIVI